MLFCIRQFWTQHPPTSHRHQYTLEVEAVNTFSKSTLFRDNPHLNSLAFRFAGLTIAIIAFLATVSNVSGQEPTIAFYNDTTKDLKICQYHGTDSLMLKAVKCHLIKPAKTVTVVHQEDAIGLRTYRPGLIDVHLNKFVKLPNIYERIVFGSTGTTFRKRPSGLPSTIQYVLKVCNRTSADPVYFLLGFDDGKNLYTQGWWIVKKNECKDFPVSQMLYNWWRVPFGTLPRTHYYARTYPASSSASHVEWRGGSSDQQSCITMKEFSGSAPLQRYSDESFCSNNQYTLRVRMRRLPDPKVTEKYYHLVF